MSNLAFALAGIRAHVFRVPVARPVVTSFGTMHDRPAVFVEVLDADGCEGWGEIWCNFPAIGAEHRARLIESVLAPLLTGTSFDSPSEAFSHLTSATEILAIQSGEQGPIAQAIAGIDIALWDLVARRKGVPVYRLFRNDPVSRVPVYASGLNADEPEILAMSRYEEGHRRFKLKVGFGEKLDRRNLMTLRTTFGPQAALMVDANQAWNLDEAARMSDLLVEHAPLWLEEPMRADRPHEEWSRLAEKSPISLALGENLRGAAAFDAIARSGTIRYLQPDIGKWGGFSGCVAVGRNALNAGAVICPHWLGGGIGLVASWHFLAAVGGGGFLEVDSNPNPLRDAMIAGMPGIMNGDMLAPEGNGLGVRPDLDALAHLRVSV